MVAHEGKWQYTRDMTKALLVGSGGQTKRGADGLVTSTIGVSRRLLSGYSEETRTSSKAKVLLNVVWDLSTPGNPMSQRILFTHIYSNPQRIVMNRRYGMVP